MARQSITLTPPNDEWLRSQFDTQEYASKSELVNDLIRQARRNQSELDWLRSRLDHAEASGFTQASRADILAQAKDRVIEKL